jgi:hypothetical protein
MMNPNFMKPNQVPGVSKLSEVLALHIQMSTMQHDNMTANDARQRTGRAKLFKVPVASATVIRCCHIHRHSLTVNMRPRHSLSYKSTDHKIGNKSKLLTANDARNDFKKKSNLGRPGKSVTANGAGSKLWLSTLFILKKLECAAEEFFMTHCPSH